MHASAALCGTTRLIMRSASLVTIFMARPLWSVHPIQDEIGCRDGNHKPGWMAGARASAQAPVCRWRGLGESADVSIATTAASAEPTCINGDSPRARTIIELTGRRGPRTCGDRVIAAGASPLRSTPTTPTSAGAFPSSTRSSLIPVSRRTRLIQPRRPWRSLRPAGWPRSWRGPRAVARRERSSRATVQRDAHRDAAPTASWSIRRAHDRLSRRPRRGKAARLYRWNSNDLDPQLWHALLWST